MEVIVKKTSYQAFSELGKAVRTGLLLKYILDIDARRTIQEGTNKNESFNGFLLSMFSKLYTYEIMPLFTFSFAKDTIFSMVLIAGRIIFSDFK